MPFTVLSGMPQGTDETGEDAAVKVGNPMITNLPAPAAYTNVASTQTLTPPDILGEIITVAGTGGTGAVTVTLPTAALLAAAMRGYSSRGVVSGDTLWVFISNGNSATGIITLVAGAGGAFDINNASAKTIAISNSKVLMIRFTSGAPGSEAYAIYC